MQSTVQILSTEIIKPSIETLHCHRKLKLSYLDQLVPSMYIPIIFFYQPKESSGLNCSNHSQISQHLKKSFSITLSSFYPLAGTLESSSLIDCNDAGVDFIEARADAQLADALREDSEADLHQYLPSDPNHGKGTTSLIVKITFFNCGGISIGIYLWHKFIDCASIAAFVNAWAATYRGKPGSFQFDFSSANYFPPRGLPEAQSSAFSDKNFMTKRFVFDEEALMILKREAASPLVMNPTRVEVVSAFIWTHFIEMTKSKPSEVGNISPAFHAVNLRTRTSPPLCLENVFGNCFMSAFALYDVNCSAVSNRYHDLVSKLRSSIKKIDQDYILKAQHGNSFLDDLSAVSCMAMKGELMEGCNFSSWCRFPLYEVDYGWGSPVRVCTTALPIKNATVLINTKCGKGIEAWVNMEKEKLEMLGRQIQLLSSIGNHKD